MTETRRAVTDEKDEREEPKGDDEKFRRGEPFRKLHACRLIFCYGYNSRCRCHLVLILLLLILMLLKSGCSSTILYIPLISIVSRNFLPVCQIEGGGGLNEATADQRRL